VRRLIVVCYGCDSVWDLDADPDPCTCPDDEDIQELIPVAGTTREALDKVAKMVGFR
jgi:hypothetical protein